MRRYLLFGLTTLCFWIFILPVLAQDPEPNYDRINDIAKELNCPTCTGINLADCRTLTCEQWRDKIGELVDQGYDNQEVLDYFATRYGVQVLLEPPRTVFALILWFLPVLALLAGGGWLFYTIRGWTNGTGQIATAAAGTETQPASYPLSNDYLRQVDKDLGVE